MSRFDYNTIIGRDPKLFAFHVKDVLKNAGLDRDFWDFNVYIYYNEKISDEITDELIEICKVNDINYEMHYEVSTEPFINRLYKAWNRVQLMGKNPYVIRGGSDQTFYPNSFAAAWDHFSSLDSEAVVNFQTIESKLAEQSRHYTIDAGTTPDTYSEQAFIDFCGKIRYSGLFDIHEAMRLWGGKPGPFNSSLGANHLRGDGCSWIQSKKLFEKFGPMRPVTMGFTGDVVIHDKYERAGIPSYIAGDAITYHLVRGESRNG